MRSKFQSVGPLTSFFLTDKDPKMSLLTEKYNYKNKDNTINRTANNNAIMPMVAIKTQRSFFFIVSVSCKRWSLEFPFPLEPIPRLVRPYSMSIVAGGLDFL